MESLAEELGQAESERAERERERDELERVATTLSERVVARERELKELRGELARSRSETAEALRSLSVVARELEAVRAQARGQATRIRMSALRDATEIADRIAEMTGQPAQARERLLASLAEAVKQLGDGEDPRGAEMVAPKAPEPAAPDARVTLTGPHPNGNGHRDRDPAELFEGLVEVEIGPLADFAQLVGFEDAASEIGGTSEISVKRFAKGRATLELHLGEPVALLRELEERTPFEFIVRDTRDDKLILDVEGEGD